jgi:hypothetical protein
VNVTDGRYVYYRSPVDPHNGPLFQYTHMPTNMRGHIGREPLQRVQLAEPFGFTRGCPTMKIPTPRQWTGGGSLLFDLQSDPQQQRPLTDPKIENRMIDHMIRLMGQTDAPTEQYARMGLAV